MIKALEAFQQEDATCGGFGGAVGLAAIGGATGLLEGNGHQLLNQLVGVGIAWALSIVGTLIILFLVDKLIGLRVSEEDEREGLDLSQHGEEGYDWAH